MGVDFTPFKTVPFFRITVSLNPFFLISDSSRVVSGLEGSGVSFVFSNAQFKKWNSNKVMVIKSFKLRGGLDISIGARLDYFTNQYTDHLQNDLKLKSNLLVV